jgi:hypothetical protein
MRRRWIYPGNGADPIEVTADYTPEPRSPMIFGDLPGYRSEATGLWVEGRAARREDLKRSGCRPWEGLDQEKKEAARQNSYAEQKLDASLTKTAAETFYQLPPSKRAVLTGRK